MRRKIELGKMYTMKQNSSWWSSMGIPGHLLTGLDIIFLPLLVLFVILR